MSNVRIPHAQRLAEPVAVLVLLQLASEFGASWTMAAEEDSTPRSVRPDDPFTQYRGAA